MDGKILKKVIINLYQILNFRITLGIRSIQLINKVRNRRLQQRDQICRCYIKLYIILYFLIISYERLYKLKKKVIYYYIKKLHKYIIL